MRLLHCNLKVLLPRRPWWRLRILRDCMPYARLRTLDRYLRLPPYGIQLLLPTRARCLLRLLRRMMPYALLQHLK